MLTSAHTRSAERGVDNKQAESKQLAARVQEFLETLGNTYIQAEESLQAQHQAVRAGDASLLAASTQRGEQAAVKLANLEQTRREIFAASQRIFPSLANSTIKNISVLIACFDTQTAKRLEQLRRSAMERGEIVARSSGHMRTAVVSIAAHIQGVMHQIGKKLSHSGTYGRSGKVEQRAVVVSTLDMRS